MENPGRRVPVYDRAAFLVRIMGDEELVREIEDTFLEDIPLQLDRLEKAASAGDWLTVENQAHQIKGAAANIGAEAFRASALRMEEAARSGDPARINNLLPGLRDRFTEVSGTIKRGRANE